MSQLASAMYQGKVNHRRFTPKSHSFTYSYCMWLIDVDEVAQLNERFTLFGQKKWRPIRFNFADHLANVTDPAQFKARIKTKVEELGGHWQGEKLMMMTQVRMMGMYFSPVNFHFCFDGDTCRYMLAEVSNTPWLEKHWYLVDLDCGVNEKDFHVSPFMPIEQDYKWRVKLPQDTFFAHIENWQKNKVFDATLKMQRVELTNSNILKTFIRFPIIAVSTVAAIYWQAAKMFVKGFKFYSYQKRSR